MSLSQSLDFLLELLAIQTELWNFSQKCFCSLPVSVRAWTILETELHFWEIRAGFVTLSLVMKINFNFFFFCWFFLSLLFCWRSLKDHRFYWKLLSQLWMFSLFITAIKGKIHLWGILHHVSLRWTLFNKIPIRVIISLPTSKRIICQILRCWIH